MCVWFFFFFFLLGILLKTVVVGVGGAFPGVPVAKNPPANAGNAGLIPGSEDPLEKEMAPKSSILAWEIPWTEEP